MLLFISGFAFSQAELGSLVLPKPIRAATIMRRRVKMAVYFVIAVIIWFQSDITHVLVLILLQSIVLMYLYVWWRENEIMRVPLDPTTEELVNETITRSREIAHTSKNALQIVSGILEELCNSNAVPDYQKKTLRVALMNLESINGQIDILHGQIRILRPLLENVNKSKEGIESAITNTKDS